MTDLDPKAIGAYSIKVWKYREGELVSLMMHIGDQLGLYRAMVGHDMMTADDLAESTGLHPRWLLEWLRCMAAADLVQSEDGHVFTLPPEGVAVLADESSITWAGSALGGPRSRETVQKIIEAFRTGVGLTYDDLGPGEAAHVEKAFGNWIAKVLVPAFVPAVDGLVERLEAGAKVADVGCGAGYALRLLAEAFPNSSFHGYDISEHAIELARERASDAGLDIEFHAAGSAAMTDEGPFDVVLTLDCLHDMTRPDECAADVRNAIADDGTWLIKEIKSSPNFADNRKNPVLAMMYATSVSVCMSSAMSEPNGAGYGTLGLNPEALGELTRTAGFSTITTHDFEDPVNLYYEVHP